MERFVAIFHLAMHSGTPFALILMVSAINACWKGDWAAAEPSGG
jgi:hypothetical protein